MTYRDKVIDFFGGITEWDDHGYTAADAYRQSNLYTIALVVMGFSVLMFFMQPGLPTFLLVLAVAVFTYWAYTLKHKKPMVDVLFPAPKNSLVKARDDDYGIFLPYDSFINKSFDEIPYNRSIKEVIGDAPVHTDDNVGHRDSPGESSLP